MSNLRRMFPKKRRNNKMAGAIAFLSSGLVGTFSMGATLVALFSQNRTPDGLVFGIIAGTLISGVAMNITNRRVYDRLKKNVKVEPEVMVLFSAYPETQEHITKLHDFISRRDELIISTVKRKRGDKKQFAFLTREIIKTAKKAEPVIMRAARKSNVDDDIIQGYKKLFKGAKVGEITFLDGTEV